MRKKRIKFSFKKNKPKYIWLPAAAVALVFAIVFMFLLAAQQRVPAQGNTRNGLGRLSVDYELAYKPDSLYSQTKPGDKEARLLVYIDHIIWKISYQLVGFNDLPAEYEYSVDAHLVAHASTTNKYIDPDFIVWQKDYELVKSTKITSDGSTDGLTQQVDMDINEYAKFAKSIYDKTQVQTTNELNLVFKVKATTQGPVEDTVDNSSVQLVIPMIENLLIISGNPTTENNLQMMVAPPLPVPNYFLWLIVCGVAALLMLALAALLAMKGNQPDNQSRFAALTAKIFKQYGERLVRLENPLPYQQLATISIDGIKEMIKIADEISQPVFYFTVDTVEEKKIEFYVFDSGRIYYMVLFGVMGKRRNIESICKTPGTV